MRDRVIFDSNEAESASVFLIGSAELDTRRRQLRFDGDAVDVQPKVFDLLAYLILHRDRVVSKDELFDEVWPSVVVSDASLSQTIKRARDLFRSRVTPELFRRNYFDRAIVDRVIKTMSNLDTPIW